MFGDIKSKKLNIIVCILIALISAVCYSVIVKTILYQPFLVNDQIILREIISGAFTGTPDGHAIFIMYVLSAPLAFLYKHFGSVEWYGLFMMAVFPVSLFVMNFVLINRAKNVFIKILIALLASVAFFNCTTYFVLQNEFTVNAGMYSMIGLLCFAYAVFEESNMSKVYGVLSVMCLLLGCFIRRHVFVMVIPFMALIICCPIFKKNWKKLKEIALTVGVFSALLLISFIIEKSVYSSTEWKDYTTFNEARASIIDYNGFPAYNEAYDMYDVIGLSPAEAEALDHEFGLVKDLNPYKMKTIADASQYISNPTIEEYRNTFNAHFIKEIDTWFRQPVGFITCIALILYASSCIIISIKQKKSTHLVRLAFPILGVLYFLAFTLYFMYKGRFIDRISVPLDFMLFTYIFPLMVYEIIELFKTLAISTKRAKRITYIFSAIAYALFIGLMIFFTRGKIKLGNGNWAWKQWFVELTDNVYDICYSNPDNTYFIESRIASGQSVLLNKNQTKNMPDNYIPSNFWTHYSPLYAKRLENIGMPEPTDTLLSCESVYYISYTDDEIEWLPELASYYGQNITLETVDEFIVPEGAVSVYKVVAAN